VFVVVLAVGLTIGWLLDDDAVTIAELGQPAPDFSVEVIDGGTFTLSEERGRPVIVNFWASWCGPCRTEIPDISAFAEANPDVTIIGVAVEDAEQTAREFAAEIEASYPLALGTTVVEDTYPNLGLPATYVIDENGVVTDIINGIVDEESLGSAVG
jgi:thiol-disulfide isomerase/thioredoxin